MKRRNWTEEVILSRKTTSWRRKSYQIKPQIGKPLLNVSDVEGSLNPQNNAVKGTSNLRWIHQLHPSLSKSKWTDEESRKLFKLHRKHGSHWKNISFEFPGRTDNFLKNQFFSLIRRALRRVCKYLKVPKSKNYQPQYQLTI